VWDVKTRTLVLLSMTLAAWILSARPVEAQGKETQTVESAMEVLQDITGIPDKGIPHGVLRNSEAVVVIPDLIKLGFLVGGRHGRGVLLIREPNGWSNPVFVTLTGGSIGWQAGAQATDVILLFQTHKGVNNFLQGRNKFTLGADAAIAAGPVGRQAEAATDLQLRAEILSYSRSRGLFAGAAIEGSALRIDWKANSAYYRTAVEVSPGDIVTNRNIPGIPASGFNLKMLLAKLSAPQ
jgi:lipid-binding SYLF domain-containing protein